MARVKQKIDSIAPPAPDQVIALRENVQHAQSLGITAAQDYCADLLHTSRRAWQQWERAEAKMHPAFWELATIKSQKLKN